MNAHHCKNTTDIDNNKQKRIIDISTTKIKYRNGNDNDSDGLRGYRI